jgi:hypothetical protein
LALTFFVFEKKRHSLKELVNFSQFLSKKTQKMKTLALLVLKQLVLDLSFSSLLFLSCLLSPSPVSVTML